MWGQDNGAYRGRCSWVFRHFHFVSITAGHPKRKIHAEKTIPSTTTFDGQKNGTLAALRSKLGSCPRHTATHVGDGCCLCLGYPQLELRRRKRAPTILRLCHQGRCHLDQEDHPGNQHPLPSPSGHGSSLGRGGREKNWGAQRTRKMIRRNCALACISVRVALRLAGSPRHNSVQRPGNGVFRRHINFLLFVDLACLV